MSSYSINPQGAIDTGAELAGVTQQMKNCLESLEKMANNFKTANDGNAVAGYDHAQRLWSQGQTEMQLSMAKGIQALDEINAQYLHGDAVASAQFLG
jgi:uncharacterized protein YukE